MSIQRVGEATEVTLVLFASMPTLLYHFTQVLQNTDENMVFMSGAKVSCA